MSYERGLLSTLGLMVMMGLAVGLVTLAVAAVLGVLP